MASLHHHLLRLPFLIHPSPHTTFRKPPYSSDSSPSTVYLNPGATSLIIRSSATPLRATRCYPITCVTQSQISLPHHLSSQTLENSCSSPSSPTVRFPKPFRSSRNISLRPQPSSKTICMASSSSYQNYQTAVPAIERLMSAVAYCLPFLNGLNYGIFLFSKYPILEVAFDPIVPLLSFYRSIPGASLVGFFTLYIGVVRDKKFSRYVRFNSLQAMMLDVLLVLPSLAHILLDAQEGFKFQLLEMSYSGTFVVIVTCFLYALMCSVLGRTPHFPFVTEAVDWQIFAINQQL